VADIKAVLFLLRRNIEGLRMDRLLPDSLQIVVFIRWYLERCWAGGRQDSEGKGTCD